MNFSDLDPQIFRIIEQSSTEDPFELTLKLRKYPKELRLFISSQVGARQKIRKKAPLFYDTSGIVYPPMISVEQASAAQTATYKARMINGGTIIDMTGGMGIDSYYLSKKATVVFYVEQDEDLAKIAEHNFKILHADNIEVHHRDGLDFIRHYDKKIDLIYLDPSRRKQGRRFFRLEDSEPDVLGIIDLLIEKADEVLVKLSPFLDISYLVSQFKNIFELHILSVDQECKEILVRLKKKGSRNNPLIITYDHLANKENIFSTLFNNREDKCPYADPQEYLFDANVAIRKGGIFASICKRYKIKKVAPNSHLFTGNKIPDDFPGKVFRIHRNYGWREFYRKGDIDRGIVVTRNFPDSVASIRKKTGIREGDQWYIYATRDKADKPVVFVASRIY